MSSGGTVGIHCHGHWPSSARKHFVNTRARRTPPRPLRGLFRKQVQVSRRVVAGGGRGKAGGSCRSAPQGGRFGGVVWCASAFAAAPPLATALSIVTGQPVSSHAPARATPSRTSPGAGRSTPGRSAIVACGSRLPRHPRRSPPPRRPAPPPPTSTSTPPPPPTPPPAAAAP